MKNIKSLISFGRISTVDKIYKRKLIHEMVPCVMPRPIMLLRIVDSFNPLVCRSCFVFVRQDDPLISTGIEGAKACPGL